MTAWSAESVPRALLPVLIHEMNNGTQLLVGFRSLLEIPGGEALFAQKAGELAQGSSKLEELGFALAVVSTSSGANMLLARRERRGIEILWELTLRTLERSGEHHVHVQGAPPELAPGALAGWEAPWAAAALLLHASEAMGTDDWRWRWEGARLTGRAGRPLQLDDGALAAILERVPGSELRLDGDSLTWQLAEEWVAG
jgi:hypothetical protein